MPRASTLRRGAAPSSPRTVTGGRCYGNAHSAGPAVPLKLATSDRCGTLETRIPVRESDPVQEPGRAEPCRAPGRGTDGDRVGHGVSALDNPGRVRCLPRSLDWLVDCCLAGSGSNPIVQVTIPLTRETVMSIERQLFIIVLIGFTATFSGTVTACSDQGPSCAKRLCTVNTDCCVGYGCQDLFGTPLKECVPI